MKGSADIPILPIFLGLSVLVLLFTSFFLVKNPTQAKLYAETDFSQRDYQSIVVGSVLLRKPDIRQNIGLYKFVEGDRSSLKNQIEESAKLVLSRQSREYYFNVRSHDISIQQGDQVKMSKTHFYIASPSREQKEVVVGVGGQRR